MLQRIADLRAEIEGLTAADAAEVETLRIKYLSKKGLVPALMNDFRSVPAEDKRAVGQAINELKNFATDKINSLRDALACGNNEASGLDLTRTASPIHQGTRHPLSLVREEIIAIFRRLGFNIAEGPEIEDDWHLFSSLNFAADHPARDMQDTLYIQDKVVLRTHTSTMQVRTMLKNKPPLAIIAPGKVYRRDSDLTHTPMFHQIEGLVVDKHITMADLRGTLTAFLQTVFGKQTKVRFRPSFFPFTEPSVEVDMSCTQCGGKGHLADGSPCRICKTTGWLEILGAGMVDPAVFQSVGYNPNEVTGFAFGLGVERIAMLKYGITDLRINFENDMRYLSQFTGA